MRNIYLYEKSVQVSGPGRPHCGTLLYQILLAFFRKLKYKKPKKISSP